MERSGIERNEVNPIFHIHRDFRNYFRMYVSLLIYWVWVVVLISFLCITNDRLDSDDPEIIIILILFSPGTVKILPAIPGVSAIPMPPKLIITMSLSTIA